LRIPNLSHRSLWLLATAAAILLALLYGWHTVPKPPVYDAYGYRTIAQDILERGVFTKYLHSELRTYGYPAFLSGVIRLSQFLHLPERWVGFAAQLGLHLATAACLWLALRRAGARNWVALAAYAGVVAHPFALLYPGYFLTESLSLSLGTLLLAAGIATWGRPLPAWFWAAGGLVCGALVMVRPGNVFLLPMGGLIVGLALWRRQWVALVALVCLLIPWWPQWQNNRVFHGRSTPLVASELGPLMRMMGVMFLKYTTSIAPGTDPRVKYENPFLVDIEAGVSDPLAWYIAHPSEGLKTWGSHVFNLLDQDLPLPYVEDLAPWYSPYVVAANWAMVALGLGTLAAAWRKRSAATAAERWAVLLVGALILGHLGVHSLSSVESRYGVAMLVPLYGSGTVGLVSLCRDGRRSERILAGALLLLAAGGGLTLSTWMRRQAPAIQAAMVERNPQLDGIVERLTAHRPIDTLCHSPWSTWHRNAAGVGADEEAIFVSDGKQVSLIEHDISLEPNRAYTVAFEVRGEKGSTEELSVDLYAGPGYDHPEQNGIIRTHTGAYQPVSFTWNSGPDAPPTARLRFASLARRPLRVRNVRITGIPEAWAGWTLDNVRKGVAQEAVLCTPGVGVSVLSQPVALEKNTAYLVSFEVRGPVGKAQALSVDLYALPGYDQSEQNRLLPTYSGQFEAKEFLINAGPHAPPRAELRFATLSQKPIQIRRVQFRKADSPR
jgi:4-amino-4-deoxy-L-arabinose transferase-like glycosyltransferase